MSKKILGCLLVTALTLLVIVPNACAAGETIQIIGVKTDTMSSYDSTTSMSSWAPQSNSTYYSTKYPKPNTYIFVQVQYSRSLFYSLRISDGHDVQFATVSTRNVGSCRIDELKIPIVNLCNTGNDGNFYWVHFDVWAWPTSSANKVQDGINMKWSLNNN